MKVHFQAMRFPVFLLVTTLPLSCAFARDVSSSTLLASPGLPGWELVTPGHVPLIERAQLRTDGVLSLQGTPTGYLQTTAVYENYRLHFEWRWPGKPGNSGVLLHIDSGPLDRNLWPRSLQVQLKHTRAGDVLPMAGATFIEPLSTPPDAKTPQRDRLYSDGEHAPGEWNACEITCRDGSIDITINDVRQNHLSKCSPAAGHIGFQFEGAAYELRHVTVEVLR